MRLVARATRALTAVSRMHARPCSLALRSRPLCHTPSIRPSVTPLRAFSAASASQPSSLSRGEVEERVVGVVKKFEKVKDPNLVTPQALFTKDLGLDSLDAVEIQMALEDEFSIEIPDADADKIQSIPDAVNYIAQHPKAQ